MKRILIWLLIASLFLCMGSISETSAIQKGSSGSTVMEMQKVLCSLNYLAEEYVTGDFDDMTELAVLAFQLDHGIDPTGVADTETQQAITSYLKSTGDSGQTSTEETAVDNEESIHYADDAVVNKFINEYDVAYEEDITDIKKGNIRTKYFGHLKGTYLEMINANDAVAEAFAVKISCSDYDSLFQVFAEIARILEPSITNEALQEGIHALSETGYMVEDLQVGNTLTVTFVPSGRIDIHASDYKGDEQASNF